MMLQLSILKPIILSKSFWRRNARLWNNLFQAFFFKHLQRYTWQLTSKNRAKLFFLTLSVKSFQNSTTCKSNKFFMIGAWFRQEFYILSLKINSCFIPTKIISFKTYSSWQHWTKRLSLEGLLDIEEKIECKYMWLMLTGQLSNRYCM